MKIHVLSLTSLITILLSVVALQPAAATTGLPVDDAGNVWAPYGPYVSRIQLNYYSSEGVEYVNFDLGNLDIVDWPVAPADHNRYVANPDALITPSQGEFGMFVIDINMRGGRWQAWGCTNFDVSVDDTNTGCGYHLRAALAHLYDRNEYALAPPLSGTAQGLADPSPPAKTPSASNSTAQQSWDTLHSTPLGAFNIVNDVGGFATSAASADFCAARDHIVAAGIGFVDGNDVRDSGEAVVYDSNSNGIYNDGEPVISGTPVVGTALKDDAKIRYVDGDCVIDNPSLAAANPIRFMIRSETPPRRELGTRLMSAINALFGTDVVAETFAGINQLFPIVFEQGTAAAPAYDDWEMYTGGWSLGGPFPAHFYGLYHPLFASDFCGVGAPEPGFILNYGLVCSSALTAQIDRTLATDDPAKFVDITEEIFYEFGKRVLNIPAFSLARRDLAIRDMAGLVNVRGQGYWGYLLNLRDDPNYTPTDSRYRFGGGDPTTLRWGQKQGTNRLNPFRATTLWDFNVIGLVYDGLIATSPVVPLTWYCYMCNSVSKTIDGSGNTHFLFDLKQNLRFHDGVPVTAADIEFTIENYRNVPADNLGGTVSQVIDVIARTQTTVEIIFGGRAVDYIYNTGVPILPKHIWDENNDGLADGCYATIPDGFANKCDADLLQTQVGGVGMYVGSGAFVCRTGALVGTGCAPDEQLSPGDSVLFQRFDQYHRGLGALADWNYADRTDVSGQGFAAQVDSVDWGDIIDCIDGVCPNLAYWDRNGNGNSGDEFSLVTSLLYSTWVQYQFKPTLFDPPNPWPASAGIGHPLQNIVPPPS